MFFLQKLIFFISVDYDDDIEAEVPFYWGTQANEEAIADTKGISKNGITINARRQVETPGHKRWIGVKYKNAKDDAVGNFNS